MPQFLYRLQPTRLEMLTAGPTPQEAETVGRHFAYLQDLAAKGIVLMAGRTLNEDAETFGLCVLQVEDETAARRIMEADPAVREGVMSARLFPYRVALKAEDRFWRE